MRRTSNKVIHYIGQVINVLKEENTCDVEQFKVKFWGGCVFRLSFDSFSIVR